MAGKRKPNKTKDSAKKTIPEKSIPPTTTTDPKDKLARRKSVDVIQTLQGHLEKKHDEHTKEQLRTIGKIRILKKDNERMLKKQESEYGMTLDTLDDLRVTLERTKSSNQQLYEDMEESKQQHDKLENELRQSRRKLYEMEKMCDDLKKQTNVWADTKVRFVKSEERVSDLRTANKKLRFILLNNHIDHKADARTLTTKPVEDSVSLKSLKSNYTFPTTSTRHLTVKSRYSLAGDIEKIRQLNPTAMKKKYGLNPDKLDQMNPAYLGFYLKRKQKPLLYLKPLTNPPTDIQNTYYRAGLTLPRVNVRRYDRLTLE